MNPTDLINVENPTEVISFAMPIVHIGLSVIFLIFSVILAYHWRKYGVGRIRASIFMLIYFVGGFVLIGAMTAAKLSY